MEKRVLSEEMRQALTGRVPYSSTVTFDYMPKTFLVKKQDADGKDTEEYLIPAEYRAVFKLRSFTTIERNEVHKILAKLNENDESKLQEYGRRITQGWENLFDAGTGEEIEYRADPNGGAEKTLFGTIPPSIVADIVLHVSKLSGLLNVDTLGLKS